MGTRTRKFVFAVVALNGMTLLLAQLGHHNRAFAQMSPQPPTPPTGPGAPTIQTVEETKTFGPYSESASNTQSVTVHHSPDPGVCLANTNMYMTYLPNANTEVQMAIVQGKLAHDVQSEEGAYISAKQADGWTLIDREPAAPTQSTMNGPTSQTWGDPCPKKCSYGDTVTGDDGKKYPATVIDYTSIVKSKKTLTGGGWSGTYTGENDLWVKETHQTHNNVKVTWKGTASADNMNYKAIYKWQKITPPTN